MLHLCSKWRSGVLPAPHCAAKLNPTPCSSPKVIMEGSREDCWGRRGVTEIIHTHTHTHPSLHEWKSFLFMQAVLTMPLLPQQWPTACFYKGRSRIWSFPPGAQNLILEGDEPLGHWESTRCTCRRSQQFNRCLCSSRFLTSYKTVSRKTAAWGSASPNRWFGAKIG